MTIRITTTKVTATIGGHNTSDVYAAAQRVADLWSPGMWAVVTTMLGDDLFWISPDGTENWDM